MDRSGREDCGEGGIRKRVKYPWQTTVPWFTVTGDMTVRRTQIFAIFRNTVHQT